MIINTPQSPPLIAAWHWHQLDTSSDSCGICQLAYESACPQCTFPCSVIQGLCTHAFHKHCIDRWIGQNNCNCPMCRRQWEQKEGVRIEQLSK